MALSTEGGKQGRPDFPREKPNHQHRDAKLRAGHEAGEEVGNAAHGDEWGASTLMETLVKVTQRWQNVPQGSPRAKWGLLLVPIFHLLWLGSNGWF